MHRELPGIGRRLCFESKHRKVGGDASSVTYVFQLAAADPTIKSNGGETVKIYKKPRIEFINLSTEERLANIGSKCYETGICPKPAWVGMHP